MPTLVATVGGETSNSYVTVAEADTYFDERLAVTEWTDLSGDDDKVRALIMATRRLDLEEYEGEKADIAQALKWPRIYATDDDGEEYDSDTIPTIVQHSTYELALELLKAGDPLGDTGLDGFEEVRIGPIMVKPRVSEKAAELPDNVRRWLRPVLISSGSSIRIFRG